MTSTVTSDALDVAALRKEFPLLEQSSHGKRLVYLDSAASSQRPRAVLEAMDHYYETTHANVHRGVYAIAEEATRQFEEARHAVGRFIGAPQPGDRDRLREERHRGAQPRRPLLRPPPSARGQGDPAHRARAPRQPRALADAGRRARRRAALHPRRRGLPPRPLRARPAHRRRRPRRGLVHVERARHDQRPRPDRRRRARGRAPSSSADGSQLVPHRQVDVQRASGSTSSPSPATRCSARPASACSGGARSCSRRMPPFLGGGEMIRDVRLDGFVPNDLPWKFEAGTPPIAEAIGLHAAVDYLEAVGMDRIAAHENELTSRAIELLTERHGDDLQDLRAARRPGASRRRALARASRHPRPRPRPGPRRRGRLRAGGAPLREAPHAPPRRHARPHGPRSTCTTVRTTSWRSRTRSPSQQPSSADISD